MRAVLTAFLLAAAGAAAPDARAHGGGRHLAQRAAQQAAQPAGYVPNAGPVAPQNGGQPAQSPDGDPAWPLPVSSSTADSGAAAPAEAPPAPPAPPAPDPPIRMSAEDLRANFETVVRNYLARRSEDGAWTYREPKGRARKLELASVETRGLRKSGPDRYAAPVVFRDAATRRRLRLEFTVDLSGSAWAVTAVRLLPEPGPKTAPR